MYGERWLVRKPSRDKRIHKEWQAHPVGALDDHGEGASRNSALVGILAADLEEGFVLRCSRMSHPGPMSAGSALRKSRLEEVEEALYSQEPCQPVPPSGADSTRPSFAWKALKRLLAFNN